AGAEVVENENGTAPGIIMETKDRKAKVILLPGPPGELEPMFEQDILPRLREIQKDPVHTKMFRITDLGESEVEDRMLPVIARRHPLQVAYCASPGIVRLFLTSADPVTLGDAIHDVRAEFGTAILHDSSPSLAADVVRLLRRKKARLATAESCTGGLVSKLVTDVSGSSGIFLGGIVSYANAIKEQMLGVKTETLEDYGAVSRETAEEMVNGIVERFQCDAAISLTGIAGPGGGTPEKPVGLVYAGIHWRGVTTVHELRLRRSREQIRDRAAASALQLLRKAILADDVEKA
ncbi:MAG: nicotinamide-nucleotide amidohydrolase family protein, partial [Lentisphaeria bacterium]|nr:nicotinamide-nucleotide amidohydrolase family protein [Lentisphaeria bacterium]